MCFDLHVALDAPPRFGHSTSPRRFSTAYQQRRPPPDPHTFDYPASLKQYAEWFRYYHPTVAQEEDNADKAAEQEAGDGSKPRNGIKTRWEKYKREFSATQVSINDTPAFSPSSRFSFGFQYIIFEEEKD